VIGIQTTITPFTLTMASLMIPGGKLTDVFGRKECSLVVALVEGVLVVPQSEPRRRDSNAEADR
jgi:MFS family permease